MYACVCIQEVYERHCLENGVDDSWGLEDVLVCVCVYYNFHLSYQFMCVCVVRPEKHSQFMSTVNIDPYDALICLY